MGGGARATVDELLGHVRRALDVRVEIVYGPSSEGDVLSTWADLELVGRDLGYRPRVGLERGIEAHVEWAREGELASGRIGGLARREAR